MFEMNIPSKNFVRKRFKPCRAIPQNSQMPVASVKELIQSAASTTFRVLSSYWLRTVWSANQVFISVGSRIVDSSFKADVEADAGLRHWSGGQSGEPRVGLRSTVDLWKVWRAYGSGPAFFTTCKSFLKRRFWGIGVVKASMCSLLCDSSDYCRPLESLPNFK